MTYMLIILALIFIIFIVRILLIRQKASKRDPRINTTNVSIKAYLVILLSMALFNAFQMWLFQEYINRGLQEGNIKIAISFFALQEILLESHPFNLTEQICRCVFF